MGEREALLSCGAGRNGGSGSIGKGVYPVIAGNARGSALITSIESGVRQATLVRAARSGDRVAFGALYQEYGRLVHGVLLAYVSYPDAEDLMQDVFVKALERLPELREPSAFRGWLLAIARRTATDYQRGKMPTAEPAQPLAAGGNSRPDGEAFAVLSTIQRLPECYRETLILRLVEGMTGPEIAERTGLTADSVRVNLCRGMKLLRARLEGREDI